MQIIVNEKSFNIIAVSLLLLASMSVYANSLNYDFVWDGVREIKDNLLLRDLRNIPRFFISDYFGMYRPLEQISYVLNFCLNGLNPLGYHLVNSLLHATAVIFLFFLSRLIFAPLEKATNFNRWSTDFQADGGIQTAARGEPRLRREADPYLSGRRASLAEILPSVPLEISRRDTPFLTESAQTVSRTSAFFKMRKFG